MEKKLKLIKPEKGDWGYLARMKKKYLTYAVIEFAVVLAIFIAGLIIMKTKSSWFTIIAVVGCLPASKSLVEFIVIAPWRSITRQQLDSLKELTEEIPKIYDVLPVSREKIMSVPVLAVFDKHVYGYLNHPKADEERITQYLKEVLAKCTDENLQIKMLEDFTAFQARLEGLNNMAKIDRPDTFDIEEAMIREVLTVSF
ncbi:MAG: hypothetical protein LBQ95_03440 [Lachnospiraceae bacterium]|nr:hypothetical protein [Lachnospiraceae bacterium]